MSRLMDWTEIAALARRGAVAGALFCCTVSSGHLPVSAAEHAFGPGVAIATVSAPDVSEASGLVASRNNPGVLWVHNDAGSSARIYAISTNGNLLGTFRVSGAGDGDYEDLALGPGPSPQINYLYFGDIGDNSVSRGNIRVFRIAEPSVDPLWADAPRDETFGEVDELVLTYPDGSYDAEALLVDPITGDLFIATKQSGVSQIFMATKAQLESGSDIILSLVREISFHQASGAAISADGREIILRREDFAQLWTRGPEQSVGDALGGEPVEVPVIGPPAEPNGETVAFHPSGLGYFTLSEGLEQPLYFFPRTSPDAPAQPLRLVAPQSSWRYLDTGIDPGAAWRAPAFDDSGWASGFGQLGYGQDDERTTIGFGPSSKNKHVTTLFRTAFVADDASLVTSLRLGLVYDDGVAVYLNGAEVFRAQLAAGAGFTDPATASNSKFENIWLTHAIDPGALRTGTNTLAVEVHRRSLTEADLGFDLQLAADVASAAPALRFAGPPARQTDGWNLDVRGPDAVAIEIEASTDLSNWNSLGHVTLTNGAGVFLDSDSTAASRRFYRLRR